MVRKYSKVYSHKYSEDIKGLFRYNYEAKRLEKVCKPCEDWLKDLKKDLESSLNWIREDAMKCIKSYEETGYIVITSEGLSLESWKEAKGYYMDMMCEEIAYITSDLAEEFEL